MRPSAHRPAESRARRRAMGLRSMEAVLHQQEIAALDDLKDRLGLASRSDAMRVVLAKTDLSSFTPADAEALKEGAR